MKCNVCFRCVSANEAGVFEAEMAPIEVKTKKGNLMHRIGKNRKVVGHGYVCAK